MKCQICQKNPANTHITKNINGNISELYLCNECAGKFDYGNVFHNNLLSFDNLWGSLAEIKSLSNPVRCELCGSTFNEISKTGKVGCENCYKVFIDQLLPTIRKIHGNSAKYCTDTINVKEYSEIEDLENQLKTAIDKQEFEKAAELRDKIKKLKGDN